MPALNKSWMAPIIVSVKKGAGKLWRIEKKLGNLFQQKTVDEWPIRLNLGSIQEVSRRADVAQEILKRAIKRKRQS